MYSFDDEMPDAMDVGLIPYFSERLPVLQKYTAITATGKAAVYPRAFNTRAEAELIKQRFAGCLNRHRDFRPELGLPDRDHIGFRIWESREDGKFRFAIMPFPVYGTEGASSPNVGRPRKRR